MSPVQRDAGLTFMIELEPFLDLVPALRKVTKSAVSRKRSVRNGWTPSLVPMLTFDQSATVRNHEDQTAHRRQCHSTTRREPRSVAGFRFHFACNSSKSVRGFGLRGPPRTHGTDHIPAEGACIGSWIQDRPAQGLPAQDPPVREPEASIPTGGSDRNRGVRGHR